MVCIAEAEHWGDLASECHTAIAAVAGCLDEVQHRHCTHPQQALDRTDYASAYSDSSASHHRVAAVAQMAFAQKARRVCGHHPRVGLHTDGATAYDLLLRGEAAVSMRLDARQHPRLVSPLLRRAEEHKSARGHAPGLQYQSDRHSLTCHSLGQIRPIPSRPHRPAIAQTRNQCAHSARPSRDSSLLPSLVPRSRLAKPWQWLVHESACPHPACQLVVPYAMTKPRLPHLPGFVHPYTGFELHAYSFFVAAETKERLSVEELVWEVEAGVLHSSGAAVGLLQLPSAL